MLTEIIHITTEPNWNLIQREGVLRASSDPWFDACDDKGSLPDIVKQDRYVVGIPQEKMKSWQHYGQLKPLLWFIRNRGLDRPETGNRLFFLRVPIIGKEGFVREYWHRSPRRLNSLSSGLYSEICLWYESRGMSGASEEQLQLYDEAVRRSMLSAVKISEYDGKFKVPEVWLPQDTSLERLEVMEIR